MSNKIIMENYDLIKLELKISKNHITNEGINFIWHFDHEIKKL
jgi:hypothetical protein